MPNYRTREATLQDIDVLVRHRVAMFSDMGVTMEVAQVERSFGAWLRASMPPGAYRAWVVEADAGEIVAGGGITLIPWPPGPRYLGGRVAFVYNVYTDPAHRRRGLARTVMGAIHAWCRGEGIGALALNANLDGRTLYESLGYQNTPQPMMFVVLEAGLA